MSVSVRETTTPMQRMIDDPDTGSIKRRFLRRIAAGIRTVGPSGPSQPRPEAPQFVLGGEPASIELGAAIAVEMAEIAKHCEQLEQRLVGAVAPGEEMELRAELRQLAALRQTIIADRPILADRDNQPISDQMRGFLRARAVENKGRSWTAAERASAEGDHRRARRHRVNALRGRHIAEYEAGLRPSLPGFSTPWN
jgi:hypothetical protein